MAKHSRDNFSAQVKRTLASRVAWRCSNPGCRVPTAGPTAAPEGFNSVGKAAHIAAAAPGGPRYDVAMTSEQRSCISNGIWLCSICADDVDRDEIRYPASLLHEWKLQAENVARTELGKSLPSERELSVFKTKVLGANVTGRSIGELVTGVQQIGIREIERMDPRFTARISADQVGITITLIPIEPISCQLRVSKEVVSEFSEKLSSLQKHGERLEMNAQGIRVEGTPVFDQLVTDPGKIILDTHLRRKAVHRIIWMDTFSGKPTAAEFIGEIVGGSESFTFTGELFDGLYRLSYRVPIFSSGSTTIDINGDMRFSLWEGLSVRQLPFLDKYRSLCQAIVDGHPLNSSLEIEGRQFSAISSLNLMSEVEADETLTLLTYLSRARNILRAVGTDVPFRAMAIPAEDVRRVTDVWFLVCHMKSLRGRDLGTVSFKLMPATISEANVLRQQIRGGASGRVRLEHELSQPLTILGQRVEMGKITILLSSAALSYRGHLSTIRVGKPSQVDFIPTEDCQVSVHVDNGPSEASTGSSLE